MDNKMNGLEKVPVWEDGKIVLLTWAIIDVCAHDEWLTPQPSKSEAIREAASQWDVMSEYDKKRREHFYVGLVNLDEDGYYAELPDGSIDADIREIAQDFACYPTWYAAQADDDDVDWGYGSYDLDTAIEMAQAQGPNARIAVIEIGEDPICKDVIFSKDFSFFQTDKKLKLR